MTHSQPDFPPQPETESQSDAPVQEQQTVASRLRAVHVGLRQDLEVSRHVFRDGVHYVIRDPISFETHSFSPENYQILVSLRQQTTLGETFDALVRTGDLAPDQEDAFYAFVLSVHRQGFLSLPISDDKGLYARFEQKKSAQRKALRWAFLSMQVPLWNPDKFLDRTIRYTGWLFTRWALLGWTLLMFAAGSVAVQRWGDLTGSLTSVFAAEQMVGMWFVLIVLKMFHELGHAYACKKFGGAVPVIGAYFIMMTPCAYMDASASWGFKSKWQRLTVTLGGMYIESIIAAGALFVWASTEPSLVNAMAYQVLLLSSLITVAFNINPLMRFDGYFILCDLIGMPKLRAQASRTLSSVLNRVLLGIHTPCPDVKPWAKALLILYGISATIYKSTLVLGIASMIALKFFLVGVAIGGVYIIKAVAGFVIKTSRFLWFAPETAPVRVRAVALSIVILIAIPSVVAFVPVPGAVRAHGIVRFEHEDVITAKLPGFLRSLAVQAGQQVTGGQQIALMDNPMETLKLNTAQMNHDSSLASMRLLRQQPSSAAEEAEAQVRAATSAERQKLLSQRNSELTIDAPLDGHVTTALDATDIGSYISQGAPLATVGSGRMQIVALLDERMVSSALVKVGDTVECRSRIAPEISLQGTVASMAGVGSTEIKETALTSAMGGAVLVNPSDGQADRAWYKVVIELPESSELTRDLVSAIGSRVIVQIPAQDTTIGRRVFRRLLHFRGRLQTGA